jgi:hypothetical protein
MIEVDNLVFTSEVTVDRETFASLDKMMVERHLFSLADLVKEIIADAATKNKVPRSTVRMKRPFHLTYRMTGETRGWLNHCDPVRDQYQVAFDVLREAVGL